MTRLGYHFPLALSTKIRHISPSLSLLFVPSSDQFDRLIHVYTVIFSCSLYFVVPMTTGSVLTLSHRDVHVKGDQECGEPTS
jgi:hypothetical protein